MQERGYGAYGTRRAHQKHAIRACDAGRVETQRLVERRRILLSQGCFEAGRGAGKEMREGRGVAVTQVVCIEKDRGDIGRRGTRSGRTANMAYMLVALDVSRLSGWLNADAPCQVERRAYDAERGVGREAGRRGSAAAHERHARREGPAVKGLWQGMGGAHPEHAFHGLDAGRVEGQRLIERRRRLPSRKKGTCT